MITWIIRWKWCWFALILLAALALWWDRHIKRLEQSQDEIILDAARKYGVDPALVKAVVWQESRFNPQARGTKGELGLMQIGEPAARDWAQAEKISNFRHEDLLDPRRNVMAGAWYLSRLLRRYTATSHPFSYALADYNAGRTHVLRWNQGAASTNSELFLSQMDFPGTRRYIQSILRRYPRYHAQFEPMLAELPRQEP